MNARPFVIGFLFCATIAAAVLLGSREYARRTTPGVVDVADAWAQVRQSPGNAHAWATLGDAQNAADHLRAAEESYRTSLRLRPDDDQVAGRLGFLMYGRGEDTAALALLQRAYDAGVEMPMLASTLRQLQADRPTTPAPLAEASVAATGDEIEKSDSVPDGDCSVALDTRDRARLRIDVLIEHRPATLILDTGASLTVLSESLVREMGLLMNDDNMINAITPTGPARFPTVLIEHIAVAGRTVENITAAVCNECGGTTAGGLLGLDVQAPLGMQIDLRAGRVSFADCL